jgi:hypothetical protein
MNSASGVDSEIMEEGNDGGDTQPRAFVAGLKIETRWEGKPTGRGVSSAPLRLGGEGEGGGRVVRGGGR